MVCLVIPHDPNSLFVDNNPNVLRSMPTPNVEEALFNILTDAPRSTARRAIQRALEYMQEQDMSESEHVTHELKCWPQFFEAVIDRRKTFELRQNDRNFQVGDLLHLREWHPESGIYTGREQTCRVTYVLNAINAFGLQPGYAVLGITLDLSTPDL